MTRQLYEVRTRQYRAYYVLATGYDQAKDKVEEHLLNDHNQSVIAEDGSLKTEYKPDSINEIKCLSDKLIT